MDATKGIREGDGDTSVEKVEERLDAELWGTLQNYIPLDIVYEKLPLEDRLQLRVVCKAWNHSTLQRLEPKPYFVTIAEGYSRGADCLYLNGLVKYDVASGELSFKPQPFSIYRESGYACMPPFEVEGLILYDNPNDLIHQCAVYNIHTKTRHVVPVAPECWDPSFICGMMVDTSERPYTFKLVVGCTDKKTQIYDSRSRSWSTTSSVLLQSFMEPFGEQYAFSCMCHDGCVYMSLNQEMILVYSMEEDSWNTLDFPPVIDEGDHNTLGVWDGRIFTIRGNVEEHEASVWELVDPKKQEWVKYACCSEDEYHQLMFFDIQSSDMGLVPVFCNEYLLVCNWQYHYNRADVLVMFNMITKKWEAVGLRTGKVSIEDEDVKFHEFGDGGMEADYEDDVDEEEDVDEVDEDDVDVVHHDEDVDNDGAFHYVEHFEDED